MKGPPPLPRSPPRAKVPLPLGRDGDYPLQKRRIKEPGEHRPDALPVLLLQIPAAALLLFDQFHAQPQVLRRLDGDARLQNPIFDLDGNPFELLPSAGLT